MFATICFIFKYKMIFFNTSLKQELLDGGKSTLLNSEGQGQNKNISWNQGLYLPNPSQMILLPTETGLNYVTGNTNFYHPTTNSQIIQS